MEHDPPRPTPSELEILGVLWELGPSSVRDVQEALEARRPTGYTTVLKLLQIMTEKGIVERDESRRAHLYSPRVPREQTEQQGWSRAFGLGLASLFLIPIAAVIVAVTLVGLPLAMAALGWYGVALYLGRLIVAAEIGRRMLRVSGDKRSEMVWSLLLGLLVVAVLVELPFIGAVLGFLLAVFGLGTVVNYLLAWNRRRKGQVVD